MIMMNEGVLARRMFRIHKSNGWVCRFKPNMGMILIVCLMLIVSKGAVVAQAAGTADVTRGIPISFTDVADNAWYASDLQYITSDARRILEGMPDGRFYPGDTLSVEQFLKCVVVAANQRPAATSGYWAQPYIDKAIEMGIVNNASTASFHKGISRGEMAEIITSAFTQMTSEPMPDVDASVVSKRMKDYSEIPSHQQHAVCTAYSVGILTGMPDGKFHPESILSRAEAVAVIRRVIDPSARILMATDGSLEGQGSIEGIGPDGLGGQGDRIDPNDGNDVEMWSDEAFQAFMSSDEWQIYLNPNTIAGMEDGVLLFYEYRPSNDGMIAGEERYPKN